MKNNENKIKTICSFYVNDMHLTAMILPHINRTIKENKKVLTILQNGIINNIKEILSKMNLNIETNQQILEINWTSNSICKYSEIKHEIESKAKLANKIDIIVKGNDNYIEIANENIQKVVKGIDGKEINIINCYDITKYKDITEILDKHDFVLNTSGIKNIEEVFVDYKKIENQNKNMIKA